MALLGDKKGDVVGEFDCNGVLLGDREGERD